MEDTFIGEIRIFAGNYAPRGWALCNGQLLSIAQHQALFSLLGTSYGGDGRTNFALPDMRGRIPVHSGHGQGLSAYSLGHKGGSEKVNLNINQLPSHSHELRGNQSEALQTQPEGSMPAQTTETPTYFNGDPVAGSSMDTAAISARGASKPHDNVMPFLAINFIIALEGEYPSRT